MSRKNRRQGDVTLRRIVEEKAIKAAEGLTNVTSAILAHGETTGHHHIIIDGEVFLDGAGKIIVRANEKTKFRHQKPDGSVADHEELDVPPGMYVVGYEEEYTADGMRRAED